MPPPELNLTDYQVRRLRTGARDGGALSSNKPLAHYTRRPDLQNPEVKRLNINISTFSLLSSTYPIYRTQSTI